MPEAAAARAVPAAAAPAAPFDVERLRRELPIFTPGRFQPPLAYLDNAASTQKPAAVLDAMDRFYRGYYSNVHRGIHPIAARADAAYEGARRKVAGWLGAAAEEVVFVRGATEAINLVARSFLRPRLGPGRRGAGHRARAPRQHRAVEDRLRGGGSAPGGGAGGRPRRPAPRRAGGAPRRAHPHGRRRPRLQRPRHRGPGGRGGRAGPPPRRAGAGRRRPGGGPSAASTSPPSAATSTPSPPTRRSGPPASAPCGGAASCSPRCRRTRAAAA